MTCAFSCSPFDTALSFVSQLCRVTIMTRFLDLPVHVLEAVCAHACLPVEPGRPQRGSLALTETCWEVNTIAAPIVWRTLRLRSHHMVLKEGSLQSLLAAATRIGASRSHPARLAKKLIIDRKISREYQSKSDDIKRWMEDRLIAWLDNLPLVAEITADFGNEHDVPMSLLQRLLGGGKRDYGEREEVTGQPVAFRYLESLSISGLWIPAFPAVQPLVHLRSLDLDLGDCFDLDLSLFPNLTHLELSMRRDGQAFVWHPSRMPAMPVTLWKTLRTFELSGTSFRSGEVLGVLSASLSVSCGNLMHLLPSSDA